MSQPRIDIPKDRLAAFCRKWRIVELALFGSVLREDFRPDSDVDVLVTFAPGRQVGLEEFLEMQDELQAIVGRDVDLITRRSVEHSRNYLRRAEILESAQVLYEAA